MITILLILFAITLILPITRDFYISLYYCLKNPKDPFEEFYGMIGFAGYYGQGKSMALSHTILKYQKLAEKYNKELKIYSNYHFNGQTAQLTCSFLVIVKIGSKLSSFFVSFQFLEFKQFCNSSMANIT